MRRGASSRQSTRTTGACCTAELAAPHMHCCSLLLKDHEPAPSGRYQTSRRVHLHLPLLLSAEQQGTSSSIRRAAARCQGSLPEESAVVSCSYCLTSCSVINVYTPNAGAALLRLNYRIEQWDKQFRRGLHGLCCRMQFLTCSPASAQSDTASVAVQSFH